MYIIFWVTEVTRTHDKYYSFSDTYIYSLFLRTTPYICTPVDRYTPVSYRVPRIRMACMEWYGRYSRSAVTPHTVSSNRSCVAYGILGILIKGMSHVFGGVSSSWRRALLMVYRESHIIWFRLLVPASCLSVRKVGGEKKIRKLGNHPSEPRPSCCFAARYYILRKYLLHVPVYFRDWLFPGWSASNINVLL